MNNDLKAFNKQIVNQFYKDLYAVLNSNECKRYFIELMTQSIEEEVYDRYHSTAKEPYKRRHERNKSGGLNDERNYTYNVKFDKEGITIYMRNLTKGDGGARAFMIDTGIVEGVGFYDWEKSNIYKLQQIGGFPRDFYTYMEILVEDDIKFKNIIHKQMGKKGWKLI